MIIKTQNLREAFNKILEDALQNTCSVLLLVAPDADALCACHIFTRLLQANNVSYKVIPVSNYTEDVARVNVDHVKGKPNVRNIVMLNCGASVPLYEVFPDAEEETAIHVIDSHRPFNLSNVHDDQSVIVWDADDAPDLEHYPADSSDDESDDDSQSSESESESDFEQEAVRVREEVEERGYGEEEEEEEKEEEDHDTEREEEEEEEDMRQEATSASKKRKQGKLSQSSKKRLKAERAALATVRRTERRQQAREYYKLTSFGVPSSFLMAKLADQINQMTPSTVWLAIVGVTEQFLFDRMDFANYEQYHEFLADRAMSHHNPERITLADRNIDNDNIVQLTPRGTILARKDFRFMLLRHWTLWDSMYHSRFVASGLRIWKDQGQKQLRKLLADVGIPLKDCRVPFRFMKPKYKVLLEAELPKIAKEKFSMHNTHFKSFVRLFGKEDLSASDVVFAVTALLGDPSAHEAKIREQTRRTQQARNEDAEGLEGNGEDAAVNDSVWERNFWLAYDCLREEEAQHGILQRGLQDGIRMQQAIVRQGTSCIQKKEVQMSGSFRFVVIQESPDIELFCKPLALSKLGLFLLETYQVGRKKRLPLLMCVQNKLKNTYIVAGISVPTSRHKASKSHFAHHFRRAAKETGARHRHDGFDVGVMEVQAEDLQRFLEFLQHGFY